jgi:hypothetical protein
MKYSILVMVASIIPWAYVLGFYGPHAAALGLGVQLVGLVSMIIMIRKGVYLEK